MIAIRTLTSVIKHDVFLLLYVYTYYFVYSCNIHIKSSYNVSTNFSIFAFKNLTCNWVCYGIYLVSFLIVILIERISLFRLIIFYLFCIKVNWNSTKSSNVRRIPLRFGFWSNEISLPKTIQSPGNHDCIFYTVVRK